MNIDELWELAIKAQFRIDHGLIDTAKINNKYIRIFESTSKNQNAYPLSVSNGACTLVAHSSKSIGSVKQNNLEKKILQFKQIFKV